MKIGKIIGILVIVFLIVLATFSVFLPAYRSYVAICEPEIWNATYSDDYEIGVYTTAITNLTTNITVINITIQEQHMNKQTMRHENIHKIQILRGYPSLSCEHPVMKWLSECEAYTGQNYPDWIYKKIYGGYEI